SRSRVSTRVVKVAEEILRGLLQDERRIFGSDTDAVADRMFDECFASNVTYVVKIAIRVGIFKIDRGRHLRVFHGDQRRSNAGGAARTLRVTDLRFQSGHRNLASALTERKLQ